MCVCAIEFSETETHQTNEISKTNTHTHTQKKAGNATCPTFTLSSACSAAFLAGQWSKMAKARHIWSLVAGMPEFLERIRTKNTQREPDTYNGDAAYTNKTKHWNNTQNWHHKCSRNTNDLRTWIDFTKTMTNFRFWLSSNFPTTKMFFSLVFKCQDVRRKSLDKLEAETRKEPDIDSKATSKIRSSN